MIPAEESACCQMTCASSVSFDPMSRSSSGKAFGSGAEILFDASCFHTAIAGAGSCEPTKKSIAPQ